MGHHLNNQHQLQSSLIVGAGSGNSGGPGQQIHPSVLVGGSNCSSNGSPNMLLQNSLLSQSRPRSISPPTDFLISSINYEKYNPFESTQIWSNNNLSVVSSGLDGKNNLLDFGLPQSAAQQQQQQQLVA